MNQIAETQQPGNSQISSSFGAKITITSPEKGMYLIIGNSISPESMVKKLGGEIVLRLSGLKLLAALPFNAYLSLRANHAVSSIGPVTIDMDRFMKLAKSMIQQPENDPSE